MQNIHRRKFLTGTLAAAATTATGLSASESARKTTTQFEAGSVFRPGEIVDTNVYLFTWPFSRSRFDNTEVLVEKLRSHGVVEAWTGSYEGIFHKDVTGVNERLTDECRKLGGGLLRPVGTVNPKIPGWQEDLRRCAVDYQMHGIRVHPGYQNYRLEDPEFAKLLQLAAENRLLVQIACWMEDERHHNPKMIVPTVDATPLPKLVARMPGLQVELLNAFRNPGAAVYDKLAQIDRISFDIAMLELIEGLRVFLKQVPLERILFGSYMPYFYIEANLLKFPESQIPPDQVRAICFDNARRLLAATRTSAHAADSP